MDLSQLTDDQKKELQEKIKNMSPEELQQLQQQQCIFCQIISGKISSQKLYDDDHFLAVLDINPATKGHLLILPKEHYAILPQMPEEILGKMFAVAKKLSKVLLKSLKVTGTNLFIANGPAAGQKAQHVILHLIPRKDGDPILDVEEKLIDKKIQANVKVAVEDKLNELLGVKKLEKTKDKKPSEPQKKQEPVKKEEEDLSLDEIAELFK